MIYVSYLCLLLGAIGTAFLIICEFIGHAKQDYDICTAGEILGAIGIMLFISGLMIRYL